ncbi:MAG TPA: universal stress protein [Steroidobacteraceae bacterium]|nr:universal stress protein [Steroidobacteraceae bacterium]
MQRLDRVLAVIDPTVDVQTGATKAARLARSAGATLELFACDFDPALSGAPFFDTDGLRRLRDDFLAERAQLLHNLAVELRTTGLEVTTHVHWDNPLYEGILRRIEERAPDLVVKDTHYHSPLRRTLLTNTDWNLIRTCPVPLLLAKPTEWPARPKLLAALDPTHRHAKPAALDRDILDAAMLLARLLGGDVEPVHAFFPAALFAATAGMAGMPLGADATTTDLIEAERARVTAELRDVVRGQGLDPRSVRVLQGAAAELLPSHAEQAQAAMLVMGGISRSRLKELFIGSTAERVLDRLPCDVLVVKPTDFVEKLPF